MKMFLRLVEIPEDEQPVYVVIELVSRYLAVHYVIHSILQFLFDVQSPDGLDTIALYWPIGLFLIKKMIDSELTTDNNMLWVSLSSYISIIT